MPAFPTPQRPVNDCLQISLPAIWCPGALAQPRHAINLAKFEYMMHDPFRTAQPLQWAAGDVRKEQGRELTVC
eukprot:1459893-Rhodomonas_salina.1